MKMGRIGRKKIISILVLCSFAFQTMGCTGLIVRKGRAPYEVITHPEQREEIKATTPYEVKREIVAERIEVISDIPFSRSYPRLRLGARPMNQLEKNTVFKLQEWARKTGQVIFVNKERILIDTKGGDGKWYRGFVEPGTIFLAQKISQINGVEEYTEYKLEKIGVCWNDVRGVKIRVYPGTVKVVERYRDTVVVEQKRTERYRDVDYTPALWAGLGGLLIGGVVGWIIHPGKEVVVRTIAPPRVVTR